MDAPTIYNHHVHFLPLLSKQVCDKDRVIDGGRSWDLGVKNESRTDKGKTRHRKVMQMNNELDALSKKGPKCSVHLSSEALNDSRHMKRPKAADKLYFISKL